VAGTQVTTLRHGDEAARNRRLAGESSRRAGLASSVGRRYRFCLEAQHRRSRNLARVEWYRVCQCCQQELDFSKAAIVLGEQPQSQPLMEDRRGGHVTIAHPKCFAPVEGIDSLLAAVELEDLRRAGRV
jgi:hypothetical protein